MPRLLDRYQIDHQVTALVLLKAWVSWQNAKRRPSQTLVQLVLAWPEGVTDGNAIGTPEIIRGKANGFLHVFSNRTIETGGLFSKGFQEHGNLVYIYTYIYTYIYIWDWYPEASGFLRGVFLFFEMQNQQIGSIQLLQSHKFGSVGPRSMYF
jgi:hypothetical protein